MSKRKSYVELPTEPSTSGGPSVTKGLSRSDLKNLEKLSKTTSRVQLQESRDKWVARGLFFGVALAVFIAGMAVGRFGADQSSPHSSAAEGTGSGTAQVVFAGTRAYPVDSFLPVGPANGTKADVLAAAATAEDPTVLDFNYPYNFDYAPWLPAVIPGSQGKAADDGVVFDPSLGPGSAMRRPEWADAAIAAAVTTAMTKTAKRRPTSSASISSIVFTARVRTTGTTSVSKTPVPQTCDTANGWMGGTGTSFTCVCDWTRGGDISNLDFTGISVVNYAFYGVNPNGQLTGVDNGLIYTLNTLTKRKYPSLKTVLSIGGWTDSAYFSLVAKDPFKREAFASNVLSFITNNGFDGVDLDWEFPGGGGVPSNAVDPNDAANFLEMLKSLRNQLGNRIITIAAASDAGIYKNLLPQYAQLVSWINVMSYDMCGGWAGRACLNAPLYPDPASPWDASASSVVQGYIDAGVPKNQLTMGMAFYGYGFYVSSGANGGLFQSSSSMPTGDGGGSFAWSTLRTSGYLSSSNAGANGWTRTWRDSAKVPTLFRSNIMISYDDPQSIQEKILYCKTNGLGGVMVWHGLQDYSSELTSMIRQNWGSSNSPPAVPPAPPSNVVSGLPGWRLVWSDEFTYTGIPDPSKWTMYTGPVYNNEAQTYTTNSNNVKVENGMLVLQALNNGGWTSGKVQTQNIYNFQFGRIEVRAKVPTGAGTWPAIWLLGSTSDSWPYQGEIDIMEYVGNNRGNTMATVHTQTRYWMLGNQLTGNTWFDDTAWNVFALEWTTTKLDFYVNSNKYLTANQADFGTGQAAWPFSQPFYFILNLAMGGAFGGSINCASPQQFLIDYVRYYQAA
ncbi:hypothetical protein HDU93_003739 [Gonapodya sp. JEL0774]|nr:hypothetical protein HDU93_003739 [Gonapodya sp. JEL0774]